MRSARTGWRRPTPDGAYEFKDVKAGRYTISANKGSYVGLSYGQSRPTDASKPLQILDNQTVERVDISLPRGSVITGRIVDEYGEPMSDVQIAPQSYQTVQGQRRLVPAGRQAQTDDMGEFRLFGIPPGQYYLTATWRQINPMNSDDKTAYAPMYYPGTDNIAQAQRLTIAVGQQVSDIVMALKPIRATRISGTRDHLRGRADERLGDADVHRGLRLQLRRLTDRFATATFSINGVAPGRIHAARAKLRAGRTSRRGIRRSPRSPSPATTSPTCTSSDRKPRSRLDGSSSIQAPRQRCRPARC